MTKFVPTKKEVNQYFGAIKDLLVTKYGLYEHEATKEAEALKKELYYEGCMVAMFNDNPDYWAEAIYVGRTTK